MEHGLDTVDLLFQGRGRRLIDDLGADTGIAGASFTVDGVICENRATGRLPRAMRPARVMTIAMTTASLGRVDG